MSFEVAGEKYDRYMGRYSRVLAPRFLAFAGVAAGPVLDVGCGPGALTELLVARFGAGAVAAVDPSESFVQACRARAPGADVRVAPGEALPFADGSFAAAVSQLVLSFVGDADRFVAEQRRVVRGGGLVASCMWEAGQLALVTPFWDAARKVDPEAPNESNMAFRRAEELEALWQRAGLRDIEVARLDVEAEYSGFDDYWLPFAFGVGPVGSYFGKQPADRRAAIEAAVRAHFADRPGAFKLPARAVAVRGRV